ncbi:copper homeostasis membrane protein CopD [Sphingobium cupriresistens]|uniref:Copper resistance protein CopD n=2 Tax=Sphingobium cupriresistens TaxID=1132417 RepID=A0A0J7XJC6_9SPHN|nr:copper homeostasis membrane protein CopD [Sphingobium cupriresistens]KMS52111.1 copper resistance protein CopD [Sphingobium cupriresistens LL01]RYM08964.1 copper resistance protein CopD [Sphingobium cupriresistens]
MIEGALIGARFALMIDLALLMGLPLFWWVMGMAGDRRVLVALALGGIALSALWLMASVAAMTGTPITAPDWVSAQILLTMTPIGPVLTVRGGALLLALVFTGLNRPRLTLVAAAVAAATLAWTGHAGATEDIAGTVHRVADIAHIWAAAGWIGALVVLCHAVLTLRPTTAAIRRVAKMLSRFALMGTLIVGTLLVSGAINGAMIVGLAQLPELAGSLYGWLLGAKLALFGVMLGLAGLNRWRLTPMLESGTPQRAIAHLRLSLLVETSAAVAIIGLVGWLGTLDPMG